MTSKGECIFTQLRKFDLTKTVDGRILTGLAAIGALYLISHLKSPLYGIWKHFIRPRRNLTHRYGGDWALVTGAGDGIGEQYCYELAKSGFNIILLSRTLDKMEKVAQNLTSNYGVQTKILQFDFAHLNNEESVRDLYELLDTITEDVAVVANNAGKAHANPIHLHSVEILFNMINVNINAQVFITKYFLTKFKERFDMHGKRSAMINVSSVAAYRATGGTTPYAATKAFNRSFSNGTYTEYSQFLDVLTVLPMSTRTSMNSGIYIGTISASQHAKATIDQLGYDKETMGHIAHDINYALLQFYPTSSIITRINMKRKLEFIRKRDEAERLAKQTQDKQ